jgi:shikimate kinase
MGCGKSTTGKIAARRMGCGYADTDELIVRSEKMSIPEIFEKKGEAYFRKIEADTVKSLGGRNIIVSCGGGAMQNNDTAAAAREKGIVVYLEVPFDICYNRIKNDKNRPIAASSTKEELLALYNSRSEIYRKNSTVTVRCVGTPTANARAVADAVKGYTNANL